MKFCKKIYFIGIGGIGLSALAQFFKIKGCQVAGSDLQASPITRNLKNKGIKVFIGHQKKNLDPSTDLVIYSQAIEKNNPELKRAKKLGIEAKSYPQALGNLVREMSTIAISGTHGKSTTSSIVALILEAAGFDPTVIVGSKFLQGGGSNCRVGESKYLVVEADEYKASFLNYWPKMIVLTNIDEDHLDYYHNLSHILETFKIYISHLGKDNILIVNQDDKNISWLMEDKSLSKINKKFYSLKQKETEKIKKILKIPGQHNVYNALAALTAARTLGIADKTIFKAIADFSGIWRRFEYKGSFNKAKVYDDYAHHPTEVRATLKAARTLLKDKKNNLWCVLQPHQERRIYQLFDQFTTAFASADKVIILPIYKVVGREKKSASRRSAKLAQSPRLAWRRKKINSKMLAEAIKKKTNQAVIYLSSFVKTANYLKKNLKPGDIAIIMGAGNVWQLTEKLIKNDHS